MPKTRAFVAFVALVVMALSGCEALYSRPGDDAATPAPGNNTVTTPEPAPAPDTKQLAPSRMPFGGPTDVAYADELWSAMTSVNLVGADARTVEPHTGVHPHGAVLTTLVDEVTVGGHRGQVIVKNNYGGSGVDLGTVAARPGENLQSITVMFRREAGYDSDNMNWYWAKYTTNGSLETNSEGMALAGRVAKGSAQGCIACHRAAPGGDYLFTQDPTVAAR